MIYSNLTIAEDCVQIINGRIENGVTNVNQSVFDCDDFDIFSCHLYSDEESDLSIYADDILVFFASRLENKMVPVSINICGSTQIKFLHSQSVKIINPNLFKSSESKLTAIFDGAVCDTNNRLVGPLCLYTCVDSDSVCLFKQWAESAHKMAPDAHILAIGVGLTDQEFSIIKLSADQASNITLHSQDGCQYFKTIAPQFSAAKTFIYLDSHFEFAAPIEKLTSTMRFYSGEKVFLSPRLNLPREINLEQACTQYYQIQNSDLDFIGLGDQYRKTYNLNDTRLSIASRDALLNLDYIIRSSMPHIAIFKSKCIHGVTLMDSIMGSKLPSVSLLDNTIMNSHVREIQ